jgi:putative transposase
MDIDISGPDMDIPYKLSHRLPDFDYASSGAYFLTMCANFRESIFGKIENGRMHLNDIGEIIDLYWQEIPHHFPECTLDEHIVMPNHIHGILFLTDKPPLVLAQHAAPVPEGSLSIRNLSLIIRSFKSAVTRQAHILHPNLPSELWQRNYYDRIIRSDAELNKFRTYILNNPIHWNLDRFYS